MSYQQIEKLEKSPNDRKRKKQMRTKKISAVMCMVVVLAVLCCVPVYASGDVAGAIEGTWDTASKQIKAVVDHVVFPAIDLVLAVFFLENWERRILIIVSMDSLSGQLRLSCLPVWCLR